MNTIVVEDLKKAYGGFLAVKRGEFFHPEGRNFRNYRTKWSGEIYYSPVLGRSYRENLR